MDAPLYIGILQYILLPFVNDVFLDGHRLMADNDPKHTSKAAQELLVDQGIVEAIFINY